MEHGHDDQRYVRLLHVAQPGIHLGQLTVLAVPPNDAFGLAGSATGVDQAADVFLGGANRWAGFIAGAEKVLVMNGPICLTADADIGLYRRQFMAQLLHDWQVLGLEEEQLGRAIADDAGDFRRRQAEIDRCQNETCPLGGGHDFAELDGVHRQDADTILAAYAGFVDSGTDQSRCDQ
ncbi:hypothetical protein D9M71_642710 [compost metagenome]